MASTVVAVIGFLTSFILLLSELPLSQRAVLANFYGPGGGAFFPSSSVAVADPLVMTNRRSTEERFQEDTARSSNLRRLPNPAEPGSRTRYRQPAAGKER